MSLRPHIRLLALIALLPASLALATAAQATSPAISGGTQELVNAYLSAHPGGRQTSGTELSYGGGVFVVTVARASAVAAGTPDCPAGWFCFYEGVSFGYPRGKLQSCGWQDLAWYGWSDRTSSIDNSTGSSVIYYNHAGGATHSGDYAVFSAGAYGYDSDVVPYGNMADHANRLC